MNFLYKNEVEVSTKTKTVITWRNLSAYIIDCDRKVCKQVINNVRGMLKSGELTAILGGSGSGKSSLMGALAFRTPSSMTIQGDIRIDGNLIDSTYMRHHSGYVYQDEIFVGTMTVAEHLRFMARMKLVHAINLEEINFRIQTVLSDVGLLSSYNKIIGSVDDRKVLSGGEKKRLALASELLSDPSILFLDEPTTGQDAYTANILVNQLQSLTNRGRMVLCTIHQPSSTVFNAFQKIILVANGRIAFSGTNQQAIKFFSSLGYICPHSYNVADFLVTTIASNNMNLESSDGKSSELICDAFLATDECKEIDLTLQLQLHMFNSDKEMWSSRRLLIKRSSSASTKLKWLIHRGFLQILRDPSVQYLRILQKMMIGIMAGLCFFGTTNLNQLGIQSIQGVIFILVSENTFFPMYSILAIIPQELPLFLREYRAELYSVHLYYIARIVSLLPGVILEPILFTCIVYWLSGLLNSLAAFFTTICIVLLTMNISTACGFFFSVAFKNVPLAMAYLIPFDYLLMITMGCFINISSLPIYIYCVKYISWLFHSTEALSIVQWNSVKNISCSATDIYCVQDGKEVLKLYGFAEENFNFDIYLMIASYFIFHILGYIFLLKKCKQIKIF